MHNDLWLCQASATGLFRTIFIILIIYFLFRILSRFVFPWIAAWWLRRFERNFFERNPHLRREEQRKEGEVHIDYMPPGTSKTGDDDGEYIDYQEIKENDK